MAAVAEPAAVDTPAATAPSTVGTNWCFLCGKRVGTSGRSSTNIFYTTSNASHQPLVSCIAATLQMEISEDTVASQVVCKGCHKAVCGIDDLEVQLGELREELITRHRRTVRLLQAGELPPTDPAAEEKHSRKTKLTPRLELPEIKETEDKPEEKPESQPPRRGRGRPAAKKAVSSVEADVDQLLQNMEAIHEGHEPSTKKKQAVKEYQEHEDHEESSEDGDEVAARDFVDSDDPDFEPPPDDPEFNPKKESQTKSRGRPRNTDKTPTPPKKRGRPRVPLDIKMETVDPNLLNALNAEDLEEIDGTDPNHPDAAFSCSACDTRFTVAGSLIAHLRRQHGITVLMCDLCGMDFEDKDGLIQHMASQHPPDEPEPEEVQEYDPELDAEGDFQCEICNRLFYSLRSLRDHKRIHYGKHYVCELCHKRFPSRALLEEHQNTHSGQRPYECSQCAKTFASKYCLRVHIKIHEVRPRPHSCDKCNKTFMKPEHLNQHKRTHQTKKEFVCGTCSKGFSSARNLEVHAVVHTGYKPFVCRTCGKAFARRAEILDHERTHTGERPFQCETCGATFSQRSNLQSHKRATHLDDRRFQCTQCGKSFKRRRLLDYHTRSVHTGERPYACSECNATFVYPEHFKKHRRIHTGEKPFRCEVCGKAFNSRDNRNAHRFIHSNKKPYECLVCGLGFMRKPLLYSHMQTQGHVHDTIVVNQPQVPQSASNVVSEAAAAAGISTDKVYVTSTEDPEPQHEEEVEHILIEGPVHFTDGDDGGSHPRAILVPVSSEDGDKDMSVQLVEIHLPSSDQTQWINISNS